MVYHLVDAFSTWFFISLFIVLILEVITTEKESPGWGLIWFFGWLVAAVAFSDFRPWKWTAEHWLLSILLVVLYISAGVAWSIVKWSWYVSNAVKTLVGVDYLDPARSENKRRIVTWMMWWPFSVSWWLLKWPRQMFDMLYDHMISTFRRIVERAYAKKPT